MHQIRQFNGRSTSPYLRLYQGTGSSIHRFVFYEFHRMHSLFDTKPHSTQLVIRTIASRYFYYFILSHKIEFRERKKGYVSHSCPVVFMPRSLVSSLPAIVTQTLALPPNRYTKSSSTTSTITSAHRRCWLRYLLLLLFNLKRRRRRRPSPQRHQLLDKMSGRLYSRAPQQNIPA